MPRKTDRVPSASPDDAALRDTAGVAPTPGVPVQLPHTDTPTIQPTPGELLHAVLSTGAIAVEHAPLFDAAPHLSAPVDWHRIEGMLLGLAVGDALGNTSESLNPSRRRRRHGEITDYLPNRHAGGRAVGLPSDDTQLAFRALQQRLTDGRFDPAALAERFAGQRIFGIGRATSQFVLRWHQGVPWQAVGLRSAGNGALMRIAAVVPWHMRQPSADLWAEAALNTMVTHNDRIAIGSSVAFVALLWDALQMGTPPPPNWWLERFVGIARQLDNGASVKPRGGRHEDWRGSWPDYIEHCIATARGEQLDVRAACDGWYSGAYLLETVPCVLYILEQHAADPEAALVRAVNDTRDNDTVAAIVGAAVGALHGRDALPSRWLDGLSGRLGADDDGHVFEVLDELRRAMAC